MAVWLSTGINKNRTKGGMLLWETRLYRKKLNMEIVNIKKKFGRTHIYE